MHGNTTARIKTVRRVLALAGAAALTAGLALTGAAPASADAFMDPPRTGLPQPFVNAGWEAKCTFGSSGYILIRVKGVVDARAAGWYITIKGMQVFNLHETAQINVTDEYVEPGGNLGGDAYTPVLNSADVNFYVNPNGGKHAPVWFDTGSTSDSPYWTYHQSQKGWWQSDGAFGAPYYRIRFKIGGSAYGCQVKTLPTNRAF